MNKYSERALKTSKSKTKTQNSFHQAKKYTLCTSLSWDIWRKIVYFLFVFKITEMLLTQKTVQLVACAQKTREIEQQVKDRTINPTNDVPIFMNSLCIIVFFLHYFLNPIMQNLQHPKRQFLVTL